MLHFPLGLYHNDTNATGMQRIHAHGLVWPDWRQEGSVDSRLWELGWLRHWQSRQSPGSTKILPSSEKKKTGRCWESHSKDSGYVCMPSLCWPCSSFSTAQIVLIQWVWLIWGEISVTLWGNIITKFPLFLWDVWIHIYSWIALCSWSKFCLCVFVFFLENS